MKFKFLMLLILTFTISPAFAEGVSLGATRLIYPADKSQTAIKIFNNDKKNNFLVQSWVTDKHGNKIDDFIVTPPLFVLNANTDSVLRIVYAGDKNRLPNDREELFYFNAKVIPSLSKEEQDLNNSLLVSITTKIKLFIRPNNLNGESSDAAKKLDCKFEDKTLQIKNTSQYYVNMVNVSINNKEVSKAETISPFGNVSIAIKSPGSEVKYSFINDYGVQVNNNTCKL
ncbi:fimbrial biogenesis chaperone [Rahnella sp. PAMC 25559]|uniref:fimbrial biogenesis chaperone n=1 Tax=Rahnella sp. PAMC 25559 TaxID=3423225 RepID=UPI003D67B573